MDNMLVYLLLLLGFIAGSFYNYNRRNQLIYRAKLTKSRSIIILISLLIFLTIAYVGGSYWKNYILAVLANIFLLSGLLAEGIHEKGILYFNGMALLVTIEKWENIKNANVKKADYTILNFFGRHGSNRTQYYSLEDSEGINDIM